MDIVFRRIGFAIENVMSLESMDIIFLKNLFCYIKNLAARLIIRLLLIIFNEIDLHPRCINY
jgi:chemotaxis methyl-accepting protein methylase